MNLTFKNVIPSADKTKVSVCYGVKTYTGADLMLIYTLGQTIEECEYIHGLIYDRNDVHGKPKSFTNPSTATALFKIYDLTEQDIQLAEEYAIEHINDAIFTSQETLKDPYEEGLEFETLANSILSE